MHESTFRIEGRGDFADLTRDVDASLELWCNDHCDLLRVRGDVDGEIVERIEDLTGVNDSMVDGGEEIIITENCLEGHEVMMVDTYLSRHDCLMLPPIIYERGYKTFRVLALEPGKLTEFYRDLVDQTSVVVESKREVTGLAHSAPMLSVDQTLPSLSSRQREVLLLAHEFGYYEIPRRTTTDEIAQAVGIERRTAEQHLRRAENKIVESIVAMVSSHTAR